MWLKTGMVAALLSVITLPALACGERVIVVQAPTVEPTSTSTAAPAASPTSVPTAPPTRVVPPATATLNPTEIAVGQDFLSRRLNASIVLTLAKPVVLRGGKTLEECVYGGRPRDNTYNVLAQVIYVGEGEWRVSYGRLGVVPYANVKVDDRTVLARAGLHSC